MPHWMWGIVLDTGVLFSAWLLSRRNRLGWMVMAINLFVGWTAYAITFKAWGFFFGIVAQGAVAIRGWITWGRTVYLDSGVEKLSSDADRGSTGDSAVDPVAGNS